MAAAIARRELAWRGIAAHIESRGIDAVDDSPALGNAVAVMRAEDIDLSEHRSRLVDARDLDQADLILTMTRAHLRHVAALQPAAFPRVFTLKELAERARGDSARADESVTEWIERVGRGRRAVDLLGDDLQYDVLDPEGCDLDVYIALVRELALAVTGIIDAAWPAGVVTQ
jgi:protein-tyrosine phosphatase